jgi:hypothetical protein
MTSPVRRCAERAFVSTRGPRMIPVADAQVLGTPHAARPPSPRRRTLCVCCGEFIRSARPTARSRRSGPARPNAPHPAFPPVPVRIPSRIFAAHPQSPRTVPRRLRRCRIPTILHVRAGDQLARIRRLPKRRAPPARRRTARRQSTQQRTPDERGRLDNLRAAPFASTAYPIDEAWDEMRFVPRCVSSPPVPIHARTAPKR